MSLAEPAAREERAGRFGEYGGRFVPETLITALDELEAVYAAAAADPAFWDELHALWRDFVGRPRRSIAPAAWARPPARTCG
jgi:tryptophan synthase beta chain